MSEDEWRPPLPPPKRAAGVPEDATWDSELWRWAAVSKEDATERRWAMNGALLQERSGTSYVAYYADGRVAAKHSEEDGHVAHESFFPDGKPWCIARYSLGEGKTPTLLSSEVFTKRGVGLEAQSPSVEEYPLGAVTLPSGMLAIVDLGALAQWSHEAPHHADLSGSSWATVARTKREDYVDLVVAGREAPRALATFVRAHGAAGLFDVQKSQLAKICEHFAHHVPGLDARLEVAPQRIGHGQRLRLLRDADLAHADFGLGHANVVAVFGLPRDRELAVVGKRDPQGDWAYVSIVVKSTKTVREAEIERLAVDERSFLFADGEALRAWEHERSIDGLHDLVFRGDKERAMERATGAAQAYEASDYLGFTDLPPGATPPHMLEQLFALADEGDLTVEVRPHSSHYAVLRGCWASSDEAGTAVVGGAKMCGLSTSVGDGVFPVYAEYDEAGDLCRVTVKITDAPDVSPEPSAEPHEH